MAGNVYVTIGLDKKGNVVEVRVDGRPIEPRQGPEGLLLEGAGAPGCEEVVHDWCTSSSRVARKVSRNRGRPRGGGSTGCGPMLLSGSADRQLWCGAG